jgi:hypothetical protein
MKNQILVKVASFFIITSYFLGFIIKEDSSGGGQVDYAAIINNFKLFQESDLLKIDWSRYISSSLPIYYIISKYIIPTNYSFFFYSGYFSFFISISAILITYKCLCIKNKIQSFNWEVLLIAVIPMLSPFFRTSAFWSLEENIGYFFFALTILFYLRSIDEKKYEYLAILFSCLTFYTRQNYAFLSIIIFFSYFNIKNILEKKNIIYSFLFTLILSPSLYFFYKWGGLMPTVEEVNSRIGFQRENILIILTNFFLYLFPFCIFLNYQNIIKILNKEKLKFYIIFSIFLIFFIFTFFNHISKDSSYFKIQLGGGIIYKFIFFYNYWITSFDIQKIFYILIALFGLILIIIFSKNNINFFIFSFISIIIFSNVTIIFQEYFDPLIYLSIIFFTNTIKFKKKSSVYKKLFFTVYFLIILVVFYYFKIII